MNKQWEDKSQWLTHCQICFCAVTYHLMDFHLQYHENEIAKSEIRDGRDNSVNSVDTLYDII